MNATPESILEFWFGDALESPEATAARNALWFRKDSAFDERIRERFGDLPARASRGELDSWRQAARPSLALVRNLIERAPAKRRSQFESFLSFAIRHREVIARFGRFPHRNAILGRPLTSEELSYLESGDDSF